MARPPVIVSNGGVLGQILDQIHWKLFKDKMEKLNNNAIHKKPNGPTPTASWIISDDDEAPMIYWHLKFNEEGDDRDNINEKLQDRYGKRTHLGDEILEVPNNR